MTTERNDVLTHKLPVDSVRCVARKRLGVHTEHFLIDETLGEQVIHQRRHQLDAVDSGTSLQDTTQSQDTVDALVSITLLIRRDTDGLVVYSEVSDGDLSLGDEKQLGICVNRRRTVSYHSVPFMYPEP